MCSWLTSLVLSISLCLYRSLSLLGMTVEILAMLLGSVVQGQVIAVYNAERDGVCQQLDQTQPAPQSTPSPHAASLQGTVLNS